MEYLKLRTFEIFRYIIPGAFMGYILILLDSSCLRFLHPFLNTTSKWTIGTGTVFVIASFIIGLTVDQLSQPISKIGRKFSWIKSESEFISKSNFSSPEKYTLVRQFSPENFNYVEMWNTLKGTHLNLSTDFLILFVVSLIKFYQTTYKLEWGGIGIVSILAYFLLLKKGVLYGIWAHQDLDSAVDTLKLNEQELKKN